MEKKGTPASPAMALASSVLPVPVFVILKFNSQQQQSDEQLVTE
jgi:hypothetical protein